MTTDSYGIRAVINRLRPYGVLALLGLLFFSELVLHPTQVLYADHSDLLAMHLPMKRFLVRSWQQTGELPLWCPHSFGGMPLIHDVQVAAFYPLHFPLYLLPEDWIGTGMSWLVVLHVVIAGWCMFAYAGSLGLNRMGAFVAALGYMFAGKWLLHVLAGGHYIMIPLAWLPLVLLLLERAIRRGSLLQATWAGAIFSLIVLGTHPQMTLYAGLFTALWTLGCFLRKTHQHDVVAGKSRSLQSRRSTVCRWAGLGVWTAVVAALLSAVQLLPALEAVPESSRSAGVPARELLAAALPSLFGLAGPPWNASWEDQAGLGILWIVAAFAAPMLSRGRARFEAGTVLVLLGFALGGAALLQWLPGFRLFQIPGRMLILVSLPIALLAGRASQALVTAPILIEVRHRYRQIYWRVLAGCLLIASTSGYMSYHRWQLSVIEEAGVSVAAQPAPSLADWLQQLPGGVRLYWLVLSITVPATFWLLGRTNDFSIRTWRWAWVVALLADSWAVSWPQVNVRPLAVVYQPSACIEDLVQRAQLSSDHERVLDRGVPGQPSSSPLGAALPMFGSIELEPVLGYNSFDVRRYREFLQFIMDEDAPLRPREGVFGYPIVQAFPVRNKALLDLLGVRYLLQPTGSYSDFDGTGEPGRNLSWRVVAGDDAPAAYSFLAGGRQSLPAYTLYENQTALPRVFVVPSSRPLAGQADVLAQLKQTDFQLEVLLEGASVGDKPASSLPAGGNSRTSIRSFLPNRIVIDVQADRPGFLVLTDLWYPGWRCTVDGQHAAMLRADYLFRSVAIAAGSHEVEFRFVPTSYQIGKVISGSCLAILAILGCAQFIRVRWPANASGASATTTAGPGYQFPAWQPGQPEPPLDASRKNQLAMSIERGGCQSPRWSPRGPIR